MKQDRYAGITARFPAIIPALALVLLSACSSPVGDDSSDGGGNTGGDTGPVEIIDGGSISGTLDSDLTLEANTRYAVTGNLTVRSQLTIEAGAILEFASDTRLLIDDSGLIRAIGTASRPIVFRGETQTAGFWRGVLVYSDNSMNRLEYVTISDTGSNTIGGQTAAVVLDGFRGGALALANSELVDGLGHGLFVENGATLLDFSTNSFGALSRTPVRVAPNQLAQIDGASSFRSTN